MAAVGRAAAATAAAAASASAAPVPVRGRARARTRARARARMLALEEWRHSALRRGSLFLLAGSLGAVCCDKVVDHAPHALAVCFLQVGEA